MQLLYSTNGYYYTSNNKLLYSTQAQDGCILLFLLCFDTLSQCSYSISECWYPIRLSLTSFTLCLDGWLISALPDTSLYCSSSLLWYWKDQHSRSLVPCWPGYSHCNRFVWVQLAWTRCWKPPQMNWAHHGYYWTSSSGNLFTLCLCCRFTITSALWKWVYW